MTVKGKLVLMGSGELTATMVEVHKTLLSQLGDHPQAVFIDTPAGFQLNVDEISRRAVEYFRLRVQHPLTIASYKSKAVTSLYEAKQAFNALRRADYVLIGPGSPTYAVNQLQDTPIPEILVRRVEDGGCLVAASAAALTVGRFTLPVYEIYKVGRELHWIEGMNILKPFGFDVVVVPHWNNAEGGTHDTRYCFMGEPRFRRLEEQLPEDVLVVGLDEHTACIIDLELGRAEVKGLGRVVLRRGDRQTHFEKGDRFPIELLQGAGLEGDPRPSQQRRPAGGKRQDETGADEHSFWNRIRRLESDFHEGLARHDSERMTTALLELDRSVWQAQKDLAGEEDISQAREILRDLLVLLGTALQSRPEDSRKCLAPLVEELLELRQRFRSSRQYQAADAIRDSLRQADIVVEDTPEGARWRLSPNNS
jgi:cyanophycinase-like exopeptidase